MLSGLWRCAVVPFVSRFGGLMKAMLGERGCRLGSDQYQAAEQAADNQSMYWPDRVLLRTISFNHEFHQEKERR
jgi:hypothetical protein